MTKLSNKRVKFIVKHVSRGEATTRQLAGAYDISMRRVQQLVRQYRQTGEIPELKKERRPRTALTEAQEALIEKAHSESLLGARLLRYDIRARYGVNIPHNKIHAYLREKGLAVPDKKKQKQRRYCRYERKHSLSLAHMDWHETEDKAYVLPVIDDASRKILAMGEFSSLSTDNALKVLKEAVCEAAGYNGFIRELNSDRDTTFMTTNRHRKKHDNHRFQRALRKYGIHFVPSRARHPQTNGKAERWFQEYDRHRYRFGTAKEFVEWYNNRVHGSLDLHSGETPGRAFLRKLRPECILGLFYRNIVGEEQ